MTLEALIALALYALGSWFVVSHFLAPDEDLGEVDLGERTRARAVKEAERLAFEERVAEYRAQAHQDLVTRQERMRHHPQQVRRRVALDSFAIIEDAFARAQHGARPRRWKVDL